MKGLMIICLTIVFVLATGNHVWAPPFSICITGSCTPSQSFSPSTTVSTSTTSTTTLTPTNTPPPNEIPEFPTTTAVPALIGVAGYLAIKRNRNKQ